MTGSRCRVCGAELGTPSIEGSLYWLKCSQCGADNSGLWDQAPPHAGRVETRVRVTVVWRGEEPSSDELHVLRRINEAFRDKPLKEVMVRLKGTTRLVVGDFFSPLGEEIAQSYRSAGLNVEVSKLNDE